MDEEFIGEAYDEFPYDVVAELPDNDDSVEVLKPVVAGGEINFELPGNLFVFIPLFASPLGLLFEVPTFWLAFAKQNHQMRKPMTMRPTTAIRPTTIHSKLEIVVMSVVTLLRSWPLLVSPKPKVFLYHSTVP